MEETKSTRAEFVRSFKKTDIHVHAVENNRYPHPGGSLFVTPDKLREKYAEMNVSRALILPMMGSNCSHIMQSNEDAYLMVKKNSDFLSWFCYLDPRLAWNSPSTDFSHFINYYKSMGAKGIGELTFNTSITDPLCDNLYTHAEKCGMPLTIHLAGHVGGTYGLVDSLGLNGLETVLKNHPGLRILGHSQYFWAHMSADVTEEAAEGYPSGKVIPGRLCELAEKYDNLLFDLSADSGGNAITRDPEFGIAFLKKYSKRCYFGTDIVFYDTMPTLYSFLDNAYTDGMLTKDEYTAICAENANKLLK
ncbi:hypothetical protein SDC9_93451 [bioreactor metagenome]|uniref:Amidohydrolase-related domain-containing protein n=1 Tax=bioreactor metagenome TaxID=1076179 RepID=A0A645A0N1_9ZZZZ|nr:hypothetical protein [Oscillospiraceae bacterium]